MVAEARESQCWKSVFPEQWSLAECSVRLKRTGQVLKLVVEAGQRWYSFQVIRGNIPGKSTLLHMSSFDNGLSGYIYSRT